MSALIEAIIGYFTRPVFYDSEGFVRISEWLKNHQGDDRFGIRLTEDREFVGFENCRWVTLTGKGWSLETCSFYNGSWKLRGSRAKMEYDTISAMMAI